MADHAVPAVKSTLDITFVPTLLDWYGQNRRNLPWRGERDPYRIWIAEVMLQQTQVGTVIPYYHRWLERFPALPDVARSSEDEVLKIWEGLGYYRRARLFRQACRLVCTEYHGEIPTDPDRFRRLPGVGPYTFAAVRSICFGDPLPAVDGNVKRVIARLLALNRNGTVLTNSVRRILDSVIPEEHPGDFNQALMDLGATVCTPRNPACQLCPVAAHCQAYRLNRMDKYPVMTKRKSRPHLAVAVGVIWRGEELLVCRRPGNGLLGGLWELPGGKIRNGETPADAVRREVAEETSLQVKVRSSIGTVRHAYTHFSVTLHAFHCDYRGGTPRPLGCEDLRWIIWNDIPDYAFPRANHKLFALIEHPNMDPGMTA